MKLALSILFVLVGLAFFVSAFKQQDEHQLIYEFKRWMVQWNKAYADEVEFTYRYENFKKSIERIQNLNAKSHKEGGATFGLNKFSDLSPQEFAEKYLMPARKPTEPRPEVPKIENPTLPASIDWRDNGAVTAVKNQEQCGSCWAFSTTEAIESSWILAGKGTNANTILSPQQIVDCDQSDDGCGGGNPPTAYQYVISAGGLDTESSYPYKAVDGKCKFNKADVGASIASWKYATTSRDESTLQSNLVSWGPLSICLDAAKWQDYTSGVMLWYQCAIFPILDHCVQLVGFNTNASTPYYMVRNSWGTDWGINGYIWLEMNHDTCGLTHEATWPSV